MKRFIYTLFSLVIMITCISSCGNSTEDPFTADNAIKGQVGNLYYVVPENAVLNASTDDSAVYDIPIDNSTEKYTLTVMCNHTSSNDEYEEMLQNIDGMINQLDIEEGTEITTEEIEIFLGKTIDKGCKREGKINGQKAVIIVVAESGDMYFIGYMVKTGFFDQSVWDNFYAQLKFV